MTKGRNHSNTKAKDSLSNVNQIILQYKDSGKDEIR